MGYQLTPQLNLGAHYFRGKQSGLGQRVLQRQRQLLRRRGGLRIQQAHRRLLWRGPHQRSAAAAALVLDAASSAAAVPVSPLVFVTASNHWWEKRCSGNRVAQVSGKTGSLAIVIRFFLLEKSGSRGRHKNQEFAANPNGRGTRHFQVPAAAGWLALFLHAGSEDLSFSAVRARKPSFVARNFLLARPSFFAVSDACFYLAPPHSNRGFHGVRR